MEHWSVSDSSDLFRCLNFNLNPPNLLFVLLAVARPGHLCYSGYGFVRGSGLAVQ